jgi:hypothetical protein
MRVPLVPGYNDSPGHLGEIGKLGKEIGAEKVSILPFSRLGEGKCHGIGNKFTEIGPFELTPGQIEGIRKVFERLQLHVTFGV